LTTALQHSDRSDVARIFGGLVAVGRRGLRVQAGDRSAAEPAQAFLDGELGSVRVPRPRPLAPSIDDDSKQRSLRCTERGRPSRSWRAAAAQLNH